MENSKLWSNQGDQIGLIFANCLSLGSFENYTCSPIFEQLFTIIKLTHYFFKMCFGNTLGEFFCWPIWSPWLTTHRLINSFVNFCFSASSTFCFSSISSNVCSRESAQLFCKRVSTKNYRRFPLQTSMFTKNYPKIINHNNVLYFVDISIFYGYSVYFFPFWYVAPRKIWQPCLAQLAPRRKSDRKINK
jgi:hypothetical protein